MVNLKDYLGVWGCGGVAFSGDFEKLKMIFEY